MKLWRFSTELFCAPSGHSVGFKPLFSLRKWPALLLFAAFTPFIALMLKSDPLHATPRLFRSAELGISFEYPAEMVPAGSLPAGVVTLLTFEGRDYPTFNILQQAGRPDLSLTTSTRADRFLDDYRGVGLYSVKLLASGRSELGGTTVERFQFEYELEGAAMESLLYWIPFEDYSLLLTYIDRADDFEANRGVGEVIFKSFGFDTLPPDRLAGGGAGGSGVGFLWLVGGLVGVVILGLVVWRRKPKQSAPR